MKVFYQSSLDKNSFEAALRSFETDSDIKSILCFVADVNNGDISYLNEVFRSTSKTIAGGVFPGIIHNSEKKDEGAIFIGLDYEMSLHLADLNNSDSIYNFVSDASESPDSEIQTLLVFTDAFAPCKDEFMQSLYDVYGNSVNYLGGGCGSLEMVSKPVVITNQGVSANTAVFAQIGKRLSVGCAHGWQEISTPLKITEANGNEVLSIDWKPAFSVYKELINAHSGQEISVDNFFSIAKSYPFGMAKIDSEFVVRDPLFTNGNSITIVDKIPTGELVYLLNGNEANLLKGAAEAATSAGLNDLDGLLCIDCISRVLFLEENFGKELKAISSTPLNGFLAIGEIANSGNAYLEIYNKTVVVSQL
jgi:hypothetical protein